MILKLQGIGKIVLPLWFRVEGLGLKQALGSVLEHRACSEGRDFWV